MKQIETENKVINVKKEYNTGSGKMELNMRTVGKNINQDKDIGRTE